MKSVLCLRKNKSNQELWLIYSEGIPGKTVWNMSLSLKQIQIHTKNQEPQVNHALMSLGLARPNSWATDIPHHGENTTMKPAADWWSSEWNILEFFWNGKHFFLSLDTCKQKHPLKIIEKSQNMLSILYNMCLEHNIEDYIIVWFHPCKKQSTPI